MPIASAAGTAITADLGARKIREEGTRAIDFAIYGIDGIDASMKSVYEALAEKKAAGLPPKLTVPMILFFLPVLFVVILGPAAIKVMALK